MDAPINLLLADPIPFMQFSIFRVLFCFWLFLPDLGQKVLQSKNVGKLTTTIELAKWKDSGKSPCALDLK